MWSVLSMSSNIIKLGPDSCLYENINENVGQLQRRKYIYDKAKVWDEAFCTVLEQSELYCTEKRIILPKSLKHSGAGAEIYTMEIKQTEIVLERSSRSKHMYLSHAFSLENSSQITKITSNSHTGNNFMKNLSCIPAKSMDKNLDWRWGLNPHRKKKYKYPFLVQWQNVESCGLA